MNIKPFAILPVLALLAGCANSHHTASSEAVSGQDRIVTAATPQQEQALLGRVKDLQGKWEMTGDDGKKQVASVFEVTSNGHVVRETMFPGAAHEMTNAYHMDGKDLVMTHYCAMGNQPRMRASGVNGNRIDFAFDTATNHTSADQACMRDMSLEFKDKDTIIEHWRSTQGDKVLPETTIVLTRAK